MRVLRYDDGARITRSRSRGFRVDGFGLDIEVREVIIGRI
jgi:hypothetical protein